MNYSDIVHELQWSKYCYNFISTWIKEMLYYLSPCESVFFGDTAEWYFLLWKLLALGKPKGILKIIRVMTTAGGRAGAVQSCPVSSDLNYKFQNRGERLQTKLNTYSTARLVFSSGHGKLCVYSFNSLFTLFVQIEFTWLHLSLRTCKKTQITNTTKNPTSSVALLDHILLIDILSFWCVLL